MAFLLTARTIFVIVCQLQMLVLKLPLSAADDGS